MLAPAPSDLEPAFEPNAAGTRLIVRGGASRLVSLKVGDAVFVRDLEGMQAAVLFAQPAAAIRAHLAPAPAEGALIDYIHSVRDLAEQLRVTAARGIESADFVGFSLLGGDAPAGTVVQFRAVADVTCLFLAPGEATTPVGQSTPTDLEVFISAPNRRTIGWGDEPLAHPKAEILIKAATAEAYQVAAGDYIQVLDVEGRQCSDFLAFDANALAQGRELGLDTTATRTLMGRSSPTPGLHAKYFDANFRPLVEVVQDTVGRHDTFLLACTAKYYEDAGYPGHANCSDNFNAVLGPHGVAPRRGWPAINFFYNTTATENGAIVSDEPWSRPGDYVLLRAMTDLVCASSACPDDIDPANGWHPTDIKVRIYDQSCRFSPGLATRMTPDAEPRLTRRSAFHERTSALTRNMIDYKGFWAPNCFSNAGPIEEYWACRERAVAIDLSALRKFEVIGPDSERLMQFALTRDIRKLSVGQVVYSAMCYDHGGMMDDGTLFRLGQDNFRWVCGDEYCGVWLRSLAERHALKAWVKSSTDQLHNLAVQGPLSRGILKGLVATSPSQPSLEELKWFRFSIGRVGTLPVVVSRTGYTGELGYEVWCHPKDGPALWDAIWAAGAPQGMLPMGFQGLDMVRIEAGLVFSGYEFCDQTDPFEAGIGFAVAPDKTGYVGSEALARRRQAPQRKLVGLQSDTTETLAHGDKIYAGRAQIGMVTSAVRSPILGQTIALARLDVANVELESYVEIGKLDGQQKRLAAKVVRFPHYDPDKIRVRS
jgi:aminomethyltransferase